MLFAEVSDTVWLALIAGVAATVMAVVTMISTLATMTVKELLIDRPAREAAKKEVAELKIATHEVKTTLEASTKEYNDKLDIIASDGKKTLHLVNSAMEEQKRIYMVKCDAAVTSDPTPVNIAEAKAARESYEDHKSKQKVADDQNARLQETTTTASG